MWHRSIAWTFVFCGFSLTPAFAQTVEITAYAGGYVPLANVIDETAGTAEHETGVVLGGRLNWWWPSGIGVEAGAAYALSDVTAEVPDLLAASDGASVFLGSVKALYRFALPSGIVSFHVGGGGALVSRGGSAYEGTEGTGDFGGIANIGASFALGSKIAIRVDAEDYISSAKFEADGGETDSNLQNDLVLSAGIRISFGP